MAAAGDPAEALQEEATCSICLDYFQDPLMIADCGHNFCRACITQYGEGADPGASCCPECRKPFSRGSLRANRRLGSVAELIQQLRLHRLGEPNGAQKVCAKHKEGLRLFCRDDGAFICLICKESRAHKTHAALPIDEAAQEYQDQIQSHLTLLKKERNEILKKKISNEKVIKETIRNIIHIRWQKERTFPLKEEALPMLALLRDAEEEVVQMVDENARDAFEHISHLTELMREMEEKCQQPAFEFLQDIRTFLSKCEREMARKPKAEMSLTASSVLQKMLLVQSKEIVFSEPLIPAPPIESLTFDVATAHPRLLVSRSGKSVKWGDIQQELLPGPWRFDHSRCLLSCEGFATGHHCWIVEVLDEGPWAIGVALESVQRKGSLNLIPREGIWAMAFKHSKYLVHTSPTTPLTLSLSPRFIQVYVHYENGQIVFMDFCTKTVLYEFTFAPFWGKRVHAFFHIGGASAHLRLCSVGYLAELHFL